MEPVISTFVFSEDSQQIPNQNGKGNSLHVINPQNLLRPAYVPGTYSFSVTFGVLRVDPSKEHSMEFVLESPSEEVVLTTNKMNVRKDSQIDAGIPKEANGFTFNLDFRNVALKEQGTYLGIVKMNGKILNKFPLMVYAKEN